ncbi:hypothetical protein E3E14_23775 [Streptomyces sp. ICN441]|uniref:hypothetical protein n=1 Tax=Streptomyces sp. ICN441 TaxID=2558286 RepID=UPI00106A353E|nr:hypothetical protein [Streptomyces sp. ICN441]TFE42923.1 hypothetical protein E3E14_23775 [Streptomyces sp. ICN441]
MRQRTSDRPLPPPIGTLTRQQQRGVECAFCAVTLLPSTAVDFEGEHYFRRAGMRARWYPRHCRTCPKGGRP